MSVSETNTCRTHFQSEASVLQRGLCEGIEILKNFEFCDIENLYKTEELYTALIHSKYTSLNQDPLKTQLGDHDFIAITSHN
jgi:hypothetical protein